MNLSRESIALPTKVAVTIQESNILEITNRAANSTLVNIYEHYAGQTFDFHFILVWSGPVIHLSAL